MTSWGQYRQSERNTLEYEFPFRNNQTQNLEELMTNANLTGRIPDEFFDLTELRQIYLGNNDLTLRNFSRLSKLQQLTLWGNVLNSTIPYELGNLTDLTYLSDDEDEYYREPDYDNARYARLADLALLNGEEYEDDSVVDLDLSDPRRSQLGKYSSQSSDGSNAPAEDAEGSNSRGARSRQPPHLPAKHKSSNDMEGMEEDETPLNEVYNSEMPLKPFDYENNALLYVCMYVCMYLRRLPVPSGSPPCGIHPHLRRITEN